MKILIASGTYPPQIGGMATFVENLAKLLSARGVTVSVVAYGERDREIREPFFIRIVSRGRNRLLRYVRYFLALQKLGREADIVYAQDLVSSGFPAAWYSRQAKKKLMVRIGGDFLWEKMVEEERTNLPLWDYYEQPKSLTELIYLKIYRFVLGRSKIVIFNNIHQAKLYNNLFPDSINMSKIVLNPWKPQDSLQTVNLNGDIIYVGRFIRIKNLDLLIKAFSKLGTPKKLILVGEGPQEDNLRNLISQLKIEGRVEILRSFDRSKLFDFMSRAYLLVLPSLTELNPNVVLEALGIGVPVLVTQENGLPEELKESLLLFDPRSKEDLVKKLEFLLNPQNYDEYLKKIRSLKFEQTWEKVIDEHLKIFTAL